MSHPSRDNMAGRIYLDLRALARRDGRATDELITLYILERFLYRLSRSRHRDRLVLKGGMLLAALDERRPTRDVDLLAQAVSNDADTIAAVVRDILTVDVDDGVVYERQNLTAQEIREQGLYAGIRIVVPAYLHRARQPLRIDVSIGDPVTPAPGEIDYPALLDEPFPVIAYPIETVLAEKIVTMIDRGDTTTRERDFADVALLISRHEIDAPRLLAAIAATATHRQSDLRPLAESLKTLAEIRQTDWHRYIRRTGLDDQVPAGYADTIADIAAFADPILTRVVTSGHWNPVSRKWQ